MKNLIAIALIAAATPAFAQTMPAPTPAPATKTPAPTPAPAPAPTVAAAPAPVAGKLGLDTPIADLVANPAAKAVLDADIKLDITKLDNYDQFKTYSLNQVKTFAPDKLPDALMTKLGTDLAAIK